jgi:hypothetical protein
MIAIILAALAFVDPEPTDIAPHWIDGEIVDIKNNYAGIIVKCKDEKMYYLDSYNNFPVHFSGNPGEYPATYLKIGDRVTVRFNAPWFQVKYVYVIDDRSPDAEFAAAVESWVADRSLGNYEGIPRRISAMCRQLGDASYAVRERATRRLVRMGPESVRGLVWALKSRDAEIRYRARAILNHHLGNRPYPFVGMVF